MGRGLPPVVFRGYLVEGGIEYVLEDARGRNMGDIELALEKAEIQAFVKIVAKDILWLHFHRGGVLTHVFALVH